MSQAGTGCESTMWRVVVCALCLARAATGSGYCSTNTIDTNSTWLQFTKELIPQEYALEGSFKSIHCCGKGYRSIEWFKDDQPYPWSAAASNFILFPEAANQTLYTRRATRPDAGRYTCRMTNETHAKTHTMQLDVIESAPDEPKAMFEPTDQWVEEGVAVRLYCEVLMGRSYLADARNELKWRRILTTGNDSDPLPNQLETKTSRDGEMEIMGAYLLIPSMSAADYGSYMCVAHSNQRVLRKFVTLHYKSGSTVEDALEDVLPWRTIAIVVPLTAAVIATCWVVHLRFTPRLMLAARLARAHVTRSRYRPAVLQKQFDVVVAWTPVDEALVREALLPRLRDQYQFRILEHRLHTQPDNWHESLLVSAARSRSLVAIISPQQYGAQQLHTALQQLRALPLPPIIVFLQDLPKLKPQAKDPSGERLVDAVRRARPLAWRSLDQPAFWTKLRLLLPLPPPASAQAMQSKDSKNDNENKSWSGSLDALV